MRPMLPLLSLLGCLLLWGLVLLRGGPWPVTVRLEVPGPRSLVGEVPGSWFVVPGSTSNQQPATSNQRPETSTQEPGTRDQRPAPTLSLTPRAGTAQLLTPLPCAPQTVHLQATSAFGSRTGLERLALGWPGREDGFGVVAPGGQATLSTQGHGLNPPPHLLLTSLGGTFDGSGTLEVTLQCAGS